MRTLIVGDRFIKKFPPFDELIKLIGFTPTHIIFGSNKGFDSQPKKYAVEHDIPYTEFKVDWSNIRGKPFFQIGQNEYGRYWKMAGYDRNERMLKDGVPDVMIVFGDSNIKWIKLMIETSKESNIDVIILDQFK